jgi:hypothetical protein
MDAHHRARRARLSLELISPDRKELNGTSYFQNASEAIGIILRRILPPVVQKVLQRRFETSLVLCP